ncbi:MAG: DUF559 domain-containing protein [bacterium]
MKKRTIHHYNPALKERARKLRKNMTEAERKLWSHIRKKQIKDIQFLRQRPIGNYVVDFYAPEVELVVEVDGGQHYQGEEKEYDQKRDDYLQGLGIRILRFSNKEVLENVGGIVGEIEKVI